MEISTGTYFIIPRSNTSWCLDCEGGVQNSRVITYQRNRTDAQYVQVLRLHEYFENGNWISGPAKMFMRFPLIGGGIRVPSLNAGAQAECRVWDSNDHLQRWRFVQANNNEFATIDNQRCYLFRIETDDGNWCLSAPSSTSQPCTLVQRNQFSDAQDSPTYWAFMPACAIVPGTYRIVSAINPNKTLCLGPEANSQSAGTPVQLLANDDNDSKLWLVEPYTDNGLVTIKQKKQSGGDDDTLYLCYANFSERFPLKIDRAGETNAKAHWLIAQDGVVTRNGILVPTFEIRARGNDESLTNMLVDVDNGSTVSGTKVQLFKENNSAAQRFMFLTANGVSAGGGVTNTGNGSVDIGGNNAVVDYDTSLPVPSNLTARNGWEAEGEYGKVFYTTGPINVLPCFSPNGHSKYVCRYRTRSRKEPNGPIGSYGPWLHYVYDDPFNDGWGNTNYPAFHAVRDGNRTLNGAAMYRPNSGMVFNLINRKEYYIDVELSMRAINPDTGKWGVESVWSYAIAYQPTIKITEAVFGAKYLRVVYSGNYPQAGTTKINVKDVATGRSVIVGWAHYGDTAAGGTAYVPVEEFSYIPTEGAEIDIDMEFVTDDGAVAKAKTFRTAISYNASHGMTVNPIISDGPNGTKIVQVTETANQWTNVWVLYDQGHGNEFFPSVKLGTGRYQIFPPLGDGYKYRILVQVDRQFQAWASWCKEFTSEPEDAPLYHWDAEGLGFVLAYNREEAPEFSVSYSTDVSSYSISGRTRKVLSSGTTVDATPDVKGIIIPDDELTQTRGGTRQDFEQLIHARNKRVCFRNPDGFMAMVAITGGSIDYQWHTHYAVQIKQTEWSA